MTLIIPSSEQVISESSSTCIAYVPRAWAGKLSYLEWWRALSQYLFQPGQALLDGLTGICAEDADVQQRDLLPCAAFDDGHSAPRESGIHPENSGRMRHGGLLA